MDKAEWQAAFVVKCNPDQIRPDQLAFTAFLADLRRRIKAKGR